MIDNRLRTCCDDAIILMHLQIQQRKSDTA